MADLDELRIRINADSSNAQRSIDGLVKKLDRLSTAMTGLNVTGLDNLSRGVVQLNGAMNSLNGQTTDPKVFTNLARNINKLGRLDSSRIGAIGASLNTLTASLRNLGSLNITNTAVQITDIAKSVSKLGGSNAQTAVTTIPQIATAFSQMIATLNSAPAINRNIIDLANSMARLASQGRNIRTATNAIVPNLNHMGHAARNVRPHIHGLASAFGRFYASCFLAIRAIKSLWSAIGKAMDYIEVLNYFNAAIEQVVSKADLSAWEELGYESAEAYAESFGKGIQSMAEKMTGYTQDVTGRLVQIQGANSLGINATDLMGASTNFLQIASSMGVASDNAEKLSVVLTELGADIASVKNQDFTTVWQKLQSGLVGMSRAVDAYGVNLRNANLQAELTNMGISTSVANFGQQEKALLRVIVLLKDTEFAYGDLADTIEQPANRVRILKAAFENLARSIGNLFLPVVARIIPYITTLTNALTRLNEYLITVLGFTDFSWGSASTSISDVVSDALDAEDALDGATGSANKLKKALQGFDELNNITSSDEGGSGGLISEEDLAKLQQAFDEAVEKYQKRWDEAFENMAKSYNNFADNIAKAFQEGGMYGVGKYLSDSLANALNEINWDDIKSKATTFASGLADFLNGLISPETFSAIGETLAEALNTVIDSLYAFGSELDWENLGDSAESGLESFFKKINMGKLAQTLNIWIQGLATVIKKIVKNKEFWKTAFSGLGDFFANLDVETVGLIIGAVSIIQGANLLTNAITGALGRVGVQISLVITAAVVGLELGNLLGQLIGWLADDQDTIDLYVNFHWTGEGGFFDTAFGGYNSFAEWWNDQGFFTEKSIEGAINGDGESIMYLLLFGNGDSLFNYWWDNGGERDLERCFNNIEARFNGELGDIQLDYETPMFTWIRDTLDTDWMRDIEQVLANIQAYINDDYTYASLDFETPLFQYFSDLGVVWGEDFVKLKDNIQAFFTGDFENIDLNYNSDLWNFFANLTYEWGEEIAEFWIGICTWWGDTVKPFFRDAGTSIWNIWADNLNNLIGAVEDFANKVLDGFNTLMQKIGASFSIDLPDAWNQAGIPDLSFGSTTVSHISLNRITRLAEGGIATSSTIANIGEAGKEAVLPLERNTGWMDALADRLVASMNSQGGGGSYTFVAELDGNTLFEETVRQNQMWQHQTGRSAFA